MLRLVYILLLLGQEMGMWASSSEWAGLRGQWRAAMAAGRELLATVQVMCCGAENVVSLAGRTVKIYCVNTAPIMVHFLYSCVFFGDK